MELIAKNSKTPIITMFKYLKIWMNEKMEDINKRNKMEHEEK